MGYHARFILIIDLLHPWGFQHGRTQPNMDFFEEYVHELESYAIAALAGANHILEELDFTSILNGEVGTELRRRVSLDTRQQIGAFFTGAALRRRTFCSFLDSIDDRSVWDPACGAGDLLLSYAAKLPVSPDIGNTISSWGVKIYGNDTQNVFIRAARARLVLAAYERGARKLDEHGLNLQTIFPNLVQQDSLVSPLKGRAADVILNPPFISQIAGPDCEWGSGRISTAALFMEMCVKNMPQATRILAILPDVLRTGTRYARWRKLIGEFAELRRIDIYGPFDPQADVDVFILELLVRPSRIPNFGQETPWGITENSTVETVNNYFSVSVGPVVPHRHKEEGPELAFLHSKDATPWEIVEHLPARRRFSGTSHQPPFVVIRRTSSPSDKDRAIGTIINSNEPVAIENHLIVCKPHDGKIDSCLNLIEILRLGSTNDWLNNRIRCRHLTVGSVKEIPYLRPTSSD